MAEEVKIRVSQESQGTALDDAKKDLQELKQEAAKPTPAPPAPAPAAAVPAAPATTAEKAAKLRAEAAQQRQFAERSAEKFGFHDVTARTARASASAMEREANRLERPANAEQKQQQSEERNAKAQALREERAQKKAAADEQRREDRQRHTEERQHLRETAGEETRRQRFGRGAVRVGTAVAEGGNPASALSSMLQGAGGVAAGLASVAAIAAFKIADEVITDQRERQGIALRDRAAQKMDERGLAIGASWRGTSSGALAAEQATEAERAKRDANREELERKGRRAWYNPLRLFGEQTWEGQRNLEENDIAQGRDLRLVQEKKKQTREKFLGEEGGIEMDLARHRAERSQSGQRAAFVDEQKKQWLARYRGLRGMGANDEQAGGTAGLEMETRLRDRQAAAGSGLVDARSGAGDIAAAARWGGMSTPGMEEVKAAVNAVNATLLKSEAAMLELHSRQDLSVP